jgi:hypothetical protein
MFARSRRADEELHRHAVENIARAGALLFGRVTYEMMKRNRSRSERLQPP